MRRKHCHFERNLYAGNEGEGGLIRSKHIKRIDFTWSIHVGKKNMTVKTRRLSDWGCGWGRGGGRGGEEKPIGLIQSIC